MHTSGSKHFFVPTDITGLQMWLDGKDPSNTGTQPLVGATVTTWSDKSGNARNGTGVGDPTFVSGGGILFNGTTQYYTTTYIAAPTAETAFVVVNFTSTAANPSMIGVCNTASGGRQFGLYQTKLNVANYNIAGYGLGPTIIPINTTLLLDYTFEPGTFTAYYNAIQDGVATPGGIVFTNSGNTAIGATIGTDLNPGGLMYGTISEIVIYNTVITTAQRQSVEGYLAWKWGIQASLPVGHPYKSVSP